MRHLIALVLVAGCASAGAPPGGPDRKAPPEVTAVSPDSGQTNVKLKTAEFRFDEVVSDRPSGGATGLDQIFLLSPRNGNAVVSWHRTRVTVRPRNGFRPNTAYKITMLPGLIDLHGNVRKETKTILFSTGATFPAFSIVGRVFDWAAQRPALGAYVEAVSRADTNLVYMAATDSSGQFDVGPLDAGDYLLRALIDLNNNRTRDRNEKWDSVGVVVSNVRPTVELDAIERDTLPAVIQNITTADSVTLKVTFDKPLDPLLALQPALIRLVRSDSTPLEVVSVQFQAAYDAAIQARVADSTRRADSTRAAAQPTPARPPIPVPTPGAGGRTAPPPPKPRLPPPDHGVVITVSPTTPLTPGSYILTARSMRNLLGRSRDVPRQFSVARPTQKDSTQRARPDSTRRPPPTVPPRPPPLR